jgi:hypothetical protein
VRCTTLRNYAAQLRCETTEGRSPAALLSEAEHHLTFGELQLEKMN